MSHKLTSLAVTGLLLVLIPAVRAELINFDDLDSSAGEPLPDNYKNFTWINFQWLDSRTFPGSGYTAGATSPYNIAYNGDGLEASFLSDTPFNLDSLNATAAWDLGLSLEIYASRNGTLVYDQTFSIDETQPTFLKLGWDNVDTVTFVPSGGTDDPAALGAGPNFSIDDLQVTPIPEPATWGVFGSLALLGLGLTRRLRRSASAAA